MNLFPRSWSTIAWLAGVALALLGLIAQSAQAARPVSPAAVITVNTTADELNSDGDCSLREAIQAANADAGVDACAAGSGDDTIILPAGTYTLTLAGADEDGNLTGDLDITATLTLAGAGMATTIINANGLDRALHVPTVGVTLTILNLTVRNGRVAGAGNFGGGLLAAGPVVVSNTTFFSNTINSYPSTGGGGGAYFGAAATVIGTAFTRNTAVDSPGGGAWFNGPAAVTGTTFTSNAGHHGGGAWFNATTAVTGTHFLSNTASIQGGGAWFSGTTSALNVTFVGNTAFGGGGGAWFDNSAAVQAATFSGNTADYPNSGGGAYFYNPAVVTGTTFISNTAGDSGGGAYFYSTAVVTGTAFLSNTAPGLSSGGGGGAYFEEAAVVTDTVFLHNTGGQGGGAYFRDRAMVTGATFGHNQSSEGAGIFLVSNPVTLTNSTVSANQGSGIFNYGSVLALYNSTVSRNTGVGITPGGSVTLQNSLLAGNGAGAAGPDCAGLIGSAGYNLVGSTASCSFVATTGDLVNINPQVWLTLIGTPGTLPLLPGSPAINAGHPGGCRDHLGHLLTTDQRGVARVGRCDIGAYEFDPGNNPISQSFLPALWKPIPRHGINGTVTENGAPVAGISLDLRFYNGSAFSTLATTTTDANGDYFFIGVPSLHPGQTYYVRYLNTTTPNRLFTWHTPLLTAYAGGSVMAAGDLDVANIELLSPNAGATVPLPHTFQWAPRSATPTDDYEFNLFDYADGNPYFFTDPPLGYVSSFTLTGLPPGFNTGVDYAWTMWVYGPDGGYGISYWNYFVTFSSSGAALTLSEPHALADTWHGQEGEVWRQPHLGSSAVDHR